jgi:competence protein ComEA
MREENEKMNRLGVLCLWIVAVLLVPMGTAYAEQKSDSKSKPAEELLVDINTASVKELAELPGIGEKVAARVVSYREENGRFKKIEEIMNVRGIGEKTFVKLRDSLIVKSGSKKGSSKKKS